MRQLLLTFAFAFWLLPLLHAQQTSGPALHGTTWKGNFSVPDPIDCLLQFKKDTLLMLYAGVDPINLAGDGRMVTGKDSAALEVMTYIQHGDTVTISKVTGGSPCGNEPGVYLAQRSNGKMSFIVIKDACAIREGALDKTGMVQVK
jgi:hypothetical protein